MTKKVYSVAKMQNRLGNEALGKDIGCKFSFSLLAVAMVTHC